MLSDILVKLALKHRRRIDVVLDSIDQVVLCKYAKEYCNIYVLCRNPFQKNAIEWQYGLKAAGYGVPLKTDVYIATYPDWNQTKYMNVQYLAFSSRYKIKGYKQVYTLNWNWYQKISTIPPKARQQIIKPLPKRTEQQEPVRPEPAADAPEYAFDRSKYENTNIPIVVRTYQRPEYLNYTLNSLLKTDLLGSSNITVVDDCSDDDAAVKYLTTANRVRLPQVDFEALAGGMYGEWKEKVGELPPIPNAVGLNHRVRVVRFQENLGDMNGLLKTLDTAFQANPEAEFVVLTENDVVFNKDWLGRMVRRYDELKSRGIKVGCVADYIPGKRTGDYQNREVKYIMGVCFLTTRALYEQMKAAGEFQKTYQPITQDQKAALPMSEKIGRYNTSGDLQLSAIAKRLGFCLFLVGDRSGVQHIGMSSSLNPRETGLRISEQFDGPFEFDADAVKNLPKTF